MNEDHRSNIANDETRFSRQVAHRRRATEGAARSPKECLVRPGHVGARRLVRDDSDRDRRGLGIWVDKQYPSRYSWTLMFLLMGLIIGCLNAWLWVQSEIKEMQEDPDE